MSFRLSVFNIPASLPLKDFIGAFAAMPGYKQADYVSSYNNQTIGAIAEFVSYETAEVAKRHLNNHRFPGSASGIGNRRLTQSWTSFGRNPRLTKCSLPWCLDTASLQPRPCGRTALTKLFRLLSNRPT